MTDKELLYQILGRELENLISAYVPALNMFSTPIKNYIINFIDPYVDLFIKGEKVDINTAGAYVDSEVSNKIQKFINKYESERNQME